MSLRTSLLPVVDIIRSIADQTLIIGGTGLDVREYTVKIQVIRWDSGKTRLGQTIVSETTIVPRPRVKERDGGTILVVDQITPAYSGGGYSPTALNPPTPPGTEVQYQVTGPDGVPRQYKLIEITTDRPFNTTVTLHTLDRKRPQ